MRMAAPHWLQKRVPGTMFAPQELQNAMGITSRKTVGASISHIGEEAQRDKSGAAGCLADQKEGETPSGQRPGTAALHGGATKTLAPEAGGVVGHGEAQQQEEEK